MEFNYEEYVTMPSLDSLTDNGKQWLEGVMPDFSISGMVEDLTAGRYVIDPKNIIEATYKVFAGEVYSAVKILALICAVAILGAVAENLRESFQKKSFEIVGVLTAGIICALGIEIFSEMSVYAKDAARDMRTIMAALLPTLASLMAGGGYALAGSVTHPVLLFMCNVFAVIFDKVLIPLSVAYMAISMLDALDGTIKLSALRGLIKKVYNFTVGIVMTFFTGILAVTNFAAVALDGLGARGARFAVSAMVPFVGSSISDAMSAVASACIAIKSAAGVAAIAAIGAVCLTPVVKTGTVVLAMRLCAAVCEPIADPKTIDSVSAAADSLSMINAAVLSIAVMLIISISIIVGVKS